MVKNPESAPPPLTGWIFLQTGQCQAAGASFPVKPKRLKNILNPGQNMHVEGTEPHKKQYLSKGNSVGEFMRRWQFLKNPDRPELRGTDFVHR